MLKIRPMSEEEFPFVMGDPHQEYINGMAKARNITYEKAKEVADTEVKSILPHGLHSPHHYFYSAILDGIFIGFAWFEFKGNNESKTAWGYNIHIKEQYRLQGHAKDIFEKLKEELKSLGAKQISIHVYADNLPAISLYKQYGFETKNIVMAKQL